MKKNKKILLLLTFSCMVSFFKNSPASEPSIPASTSTAIEVLRFIGEDHGVLSTLKKLTYDPLQDWVVEPALNFGADLITESWKDPNVAKGLGLSAAILAGVHYMEWDKPLINAAYTTGAAAKDLIRPNKNISDLLQNNTTQTEHTIWIKIGDDTLEYNPNKNFLKETSIKKKPFLDPATRNKEIYIYRALMGGWSYLKGDAAKTDYGKAAMKKGFHTAYIQNFINLEKLKPNFIPEKSFLEAFLSFSRLSTFPIQVGGTVTIKGYPKRHLNPISIDITKESNDHTWSKTAQLTYEKYIQPMFSKLLYKISDIKLPASQSKKHSLSIIPASILKTIFDKNTLATKVAGLPLDPLLGTLPHLLIANSTAFESYNPTDIETDFKNWAKAYLEKGKKNINTHFILQPTCTVEWPDEVKTIYSLKNQKINFGIPNLTTIKNVNPLSTTSIKNQIQDSNRIILILNQIKIYLTHIEAAINTIFELKNKLELLKFNDHAFLGQNIYNELQQSIIDAFNLNNNNAQIDNYMPKANGGLIANCSMDDAITYYLTKYDEALHAHTDSNKLMRRITALKLALSVATMQNKVAAQNQLLYNEILTDLDNIINKNKLQSIVNELLAINKNSAQMSQHPSSNSTINSIFLTITSMTKNIYDSLNGFLNTPNQTVNLSTIKNDIQTLKNKIYDPAFSNTIQHIIETSGFSYNHELHNLIDIPNSLITFIEACHTYAQQNQTDLTKLYPPYINAIYDLYIKPIFT